VESLEYMPSIALVLCLGLLWGSIFWLRRHGERLPDKIRPRYLPSNTFLFLLSLLLLFWVATRLWGSATGQVVGLAILTGAACMGSYRTMVAEGGFRAFIRRYLWFADRRGAPYPARVHGCLCRPGAARFWKGRPGPPCRHHGGCNDRAGMGDLGLWPVKERLGLGALVVEGRVGR